MENEFMAEAIKLARQNIENGSGGPFGAVVVCENRIVGRGANHVTLTHDPTAHAEIVAIREACTHLRTFQLTGCEIYTTCEPCPMCLGAIYWARLSRVYFAATRFDAEAAGFSDEFIYEELDKPTHERVLTMVSLNRELALPLFQEWQESPGHTPY